MEDLSAQGATSSSAPTGRESLPFFLVRAEARGPKSCRSIASLHSMKTCDVRSNGRALNSKTNMGIFRLNNSCPLLSCCKRRPPRRVTGAAQTDSGSSWPSLFVWLVSREGRRAPPSIHPLVPSRYFFARSGKGLNARTPPPCTEPSIRPLASRPRAIAIPRVPVGCLKGAAAGFNLPRHISFAVSPCELGVP